MSILVGGFRSRINRVEIDAQKEVLLSFGLLIHPSTRNNVLALWNGMRHKSIMSPEEFKHALGKIDLYQVDFADLMGVSSRAVSLWANGPVRVPGPVQAYLRLLLSLPPEMQRVELSQLFMLGEEGEHATGPS